MVNPSPSKNNDTKRKHDVSDHAYDIGSSRKHQKLTTQPKDDTSSVPGSSNTVKGEPAAGTSPVKEVPFLLHKWIKAALVARKVWEAKRDQHSELKLQHYESLITSITYYYTHVYPVLPPNWKYDPATAVTLEPMDNVVTLEPERKLKNKSFQDSDDDSDSDSSDCGFNVPSIISRKLISVPLKEDDMESWWQFKKHDEGYPTSVPGLQHREIKFPVNIELPFVGVIGHFAVNCFNEVFEEFVDYGEPRQLRDPAFTECTYFKSGRFYWLSMTILADEYGFRGIYKARVKCTIDKGNRTLEDFVLTDIKCGEKGCESKSKILEDVDLPEDTGMWPRSCKKASPITYGYDYHNPAEFVFF